MMKVFLISDFRTLENKVSLLTVAWKTFYDVSKNIFRSVLCGKKKVSIMSKCRFLEMEIELVGRTVTLLTA